MALAWDVVVDVAKYAHRYDTYTPTTAYPSATDHHLPKKQECAVKECRERISSHWPIDSQTSQWWQFCHDHFNQLPPDFTVRRVSEMW